MNGLEQTALHDLHLELGARMVPFAGYSMPVQYPAGILVEHRHCRSHAALFDVGHMGQARIHGAAAVAAIEALVPGDIAGLAQDQMRYTQLTNPQGGIIDDLMVTRRADHLFAVVNAACKDGDYAHITAALPAGCTLEILEDRALLALQGPEAAAVLQGMSPGLEKLAFMTMTDAVVDGVPCVVSRSGYTGEDGFEISAPNASAVALARRLLADDRVAPAGLGARDTLRLEAGLCLYGHDIDATTTPVEAGLVWSIGKRRRAEGGFPGAAIIQDQLATGAPRKRVGILPDGRTPARDGAGVTDQAGMEIGTITSGGFGPTLDRPIAMGYVATDHAEVGRPVHVIVRGKSVAASIARLPFVAHRYRRD